MDKRSSGMLRIMYILPVLISVILSLAMLIQYTEIEELAAPVDSELAIGSVEETGVSEEDDHIRRGQELREQYLQGEEQGNPDST